MAVFAILKCDEKVFMNDKIRFDGTASFVTPDETFATTSHQISFDSGATWINITTNKYIDYAYSTKGSKTIQLKCSTSLPSTNTVTKTITVLDPADIDLFSTDFDIEMYEPEIGRYLPKKWSSWNLLHLKAQEYILEWLDENRVYDSNGDKFTAADFGDAQQVKQLSCFKTLELIYEGLSNVTGDVFSLKRDKYKALVLEKSNKSFLKLDYDADGTADEKIDLFSGELTRG